MHDMKWLRSTKPSLTIAGLVLTCAVMLFAPMAPPWPKALEATFYLLGLILLTSYPPVRRLMEALPRSRRWALFCLTGILLVAQIRDRSQQTFPFLTWNMYHARFPQQPVFLEYQGCCADGREVFLPIGNVFDSQHRTVTWRLLNLWNLMEVEQDEETRTGLSQQFHRLLAAIARRFNEQHPETCMTRVRVIHCTMPRPAPGVKLEVTRRLSGEYKVYD